MFFLRQPTPKKISRLIEEHRAGPFSYRELGATRDTPPAGYNVDHNRIVLGHGPETFRRAMTAIDEWRMFDMPWLHLLPEKPPIKEGETVAVIVRHLGFWSVNISRIVYLIQEDSRYGFAYGTTECHSEQGEERFMVEYDAQTEEVWYDLLAFSKPRAPLARLGYPFSRHLQKRFARSSLAAMKRAVIK